MFNIQGCKGIVFTHSRMQVGSLYAFNHARGPWGGGDSLYAASKYGSLHVVKIKLLYELVIL